MDSPAASNSIFQADVDVMIADMEPSAVDLQRRDAEAQGLCYDMTERLKLLHEERINIMSDLRELSARRSTSSLFLPSTARFVAMETAAAAMTTAGIVGVFAGRAGARFLATRRKRRLKIEGDEGGDT
ncbi:unnamed protein product [Scytosiphon promiscuus]